MTFENYNRPFLFAGPCSIESEKQIDSTIKALTKKGKVDLIRAGVWKPRTRPNNFEGVGKIGLKWLVNAGKKYKVPVATEVANAKHFELALMAGIDAIWIGARTTVNPFSVQEIADSIKGTDIPVFIKNPITPDINLWVGAIERIKNAGISNIIAVHRGFASYEKSKYRNIPQWNIPIELMRILPELKVICDPSHICGNRNLLKYVSQKALDLNMFGLMIETHCTPDEALSDAHQQITPDSYYNLINSLIIREANPSSGNNVVLDDLRTKIDDIDDRIFTALAHRIRAIKEVGDYKKKNNMTILQVERWSEILENRIQNGKESGLRDVFTETILESIHNESVYQQNLILNQNNIE